MRSGTFLVMAWFLVACGASDDGQGGTGNDTAGGDATVLPDVGFSDTAGPDKDVMVPADTPAPNDGVAPDASQPEGTDTPADVSVLPDVPADLPPGTLSCKQFYQQCLAACPKGADNQPTAACFDQCRLQLSPEGETVTAAFIVCVDDSGCKAIADAGQALACYAGTCSDQYFACFNGPDECKDVLTCMGGCPQGEQNGACVVLCSQDGTEPAQKQLISILQCIADACCPGDAAACGTTEGQACSKAAVQMGGACFGPVTQCLLGTY